MKKIKYISLFMFFFSSQFFAQLTIKDQELSPNTLLQVVDEGTSGSVILPPLSSITDPAGKLYNLGSVLYWGSTALGSSGSAGGWTNTTGKIFNTTLTDKVGIGTNNPLSVLHLLTQDNWNPSSGNGWGDFSLSDGTKGLAIGMAVAGGGAGDIRIWAKGGTERIMIGDATNGDVLTTVGGKVGVGVSSPDATLDVRSSGVDVGAQMQIGNSNRSHVLTLYPGRLNDPDPFLSWIDTDALRFVTFSDANYNDYNELLRIESNGNVGIGVIDPDAKLEVSGQVKITGGAPGAGKVLTSDAAGLATWENVSGSHTNIGFYAFLSTDKTPTSNISTQIKGFSESFDDGNAFNPTTGEFIIPSNGVYQFIMKVRWSNYTLTTPITNIETISRIRINGLDLQQFATHINLTPDLDVNDTYITTIVNASAGDIITFLAYYKSTSSLAILGSSK